MSINIKKVISTTIVVWVLLIGVYILSCYYQLQLNVTDSMPQRLWITHVGDKKIKNGDYVVIKFHDARMRILDDYEYIVKQVGGVGGDVIEVEQLPSNNSTLNLDTLGFKQSGINFQSIAGILKVTKPEKVSRYHVSRYRVSRYPVYKMLSNYLFTPLTDHKIVIPHGWYFLHGQHQPTFDSRYKEFGLICESQIYGKSYPIF